LAVLVASAGGAFVWQGHGSGDGATERIAGLMRLAAEGAKPAATRTGPPRQSSREQVPQATTPIGPRFAEATQHIAPQTGHVVGASEIPASSPQRPDWPLAPVRIARDWDESAARSRPGPRLRDEAGRRQLARTIQSELKRVGCYQGEVDGAWTGAVQRAMRAFIDRVNASLPVDEPDYILLTLLQGHQARACGEGCPSGQVAVGDGRCQPRQLARASERRTLAGASNRVGMSPLPTASNGVHPTRLAPGTAGMAAHVDRSQARASADVAAMLQDARQRERRALEERALRLKAERRARAATNAPSADSPQAGNRGGTSADRTITESPLRNERPSAVPSPATAQRAAASHVETRASVSEFAPWPALPPGRWSSEATVTAGSSAAPVRPGGAAKSAAAATVAPLPAEKAAPERDKSAFDSALAERSDAPRLAGHLVPPPQYVGRPEPTSRSRARPAAEGTSSAPAAAFRSRIFQAIGSTAP
jgi:hypothetical protein